MNAGIRYGFQQLFEICNRTRHEITQTMSAEFGMNRSTFLLYILNEDNSTPHFRIYEYCPRLTEDEISQQSADQFPRSCFKPVEFDGFRMQAEFLDSKLEREENP
jgi:hypothetical protein